MMWLLPLALIVLAVSVPEYATAQPGRTVAKAAMARMQKELGRRPVAETVVSQAPASATASKMAAKSKGAVLPDKPCRAIGNKCAGLKREASASRILQERYPHERIQSETYLLNRNGTRAIDPKSKTSRRVDLVMFGDGKVTRRYEVTSQYASKTEQLAKEARIFDKRANGSIRTGDVYVQDRATGQLVPVKPSTSEVIRFK